MLNYIFALTRMDIHNDNVRERVHRSTGNSITAAAAELWVAVERVKGENLF